MYLKTQYNVDFSIGLTYIFFITEIYSTVYQGFTVSLLYKVILSVCLSVRGLFAPTGHSFQDTDIWLILFHPKY